MHSDEEIKDIHWRAGLLALWKLIQPEKKGFYIIAFLGVFSAALNGSVPYLTGKFFDALTNYVKDEITVVVVFGVLSVWFAAQFFSNAIDWYTAHLFRSLDTRLEMRIQSEGLTYLLRLPMSYHKRERMADIVDTISRAGWMTSNALGAMVDIAPQLFAVLVGIGIAMYINVQLACVLILGAVVYSIILTRVARNSGEIFRRGHKLWNTAWGDITSVIPHVEAVKASTSESFEETKTKDAYFKKAYIPWMKMENVWSYTNLYQRVVILIVQSTIFVGSIFFVSNGSITLGELVAFNGYSLMFLGPFVAFGYRWQSIQNGVVGALRLQERVLSQESEIYTPENAIVTPSLKGNVVFNNVAFQYEDGDANVITNASFEVKEGQTAALVGESGGGKSTVIGLLLAYYFPTRGSIIVDGIDTRKFNLTEYRSQIAVVPQEVALFNDTVENNIKYGSFSASKDAVRRAAVIAQADTFIQSLPKGYDTIVGERGVKLSVGQKQRIAVARAILRDPRILILDEPTSALDSKTEHDLTRALEQLMKGRTTFIIAHRLSTVRKADKIIVLKGGHIGEIGSHDELMKKQNGEYRRLYEQHIGLRE